MDSSKLSADLKRILQELDAATLQDLKDFIINRLEKRSMAIGDHRIDPADGLYFESIGFKISPNEVRDIFLSIFDKEDNLKSKIHLENIIQFPIDEFPIYLYFTKESEVCLSLHVMKDGKPKNLNKQVASDIGKCVIEGQPKQVADRYLRHTIVTALAVSGLNAGQHVLQVQRVYD